MKKLLFVLTLFLISFWVKGQEVATATDSIKYTYIEIVGTAKFLSNKVTIQMDFGQATKFGADNRYKDPATGKPFVFNSMIDALNFMGKDGWMFVQAYTVTEGSSGNVYHFLLRKETTKIIIN
jgi:hypothetical protein